MKRLVQNSCCCLTEEQAAQVHGDYLPRRAILLHAVTHVVKLREGGAELVQVVAECVRVEVVKDTRYDLWETDYALGKFEFFLVREVNGCGEGGFLELVTADFGQPGNGPGGGEGRGGKMRVGKGGGEGRGGEGRKNQGGKGRRGGEGRGGRE